jgi:catechol 2,3-dioxygenase-like lactoylglutathione lyase family enzyme
MSVMERVLGIGGFFFTSERPDALAQWYADHLGIAGPGESYDDPVWRQEEGETVFAPFGPEHWDSPHLGPTGWGINFRVADLDAMVAQLRSAGLEVEVDLERYPNGRFAQLHDPDGNAVQLWQSMPPES